MPASILDTYGRAGTGAHAHLLVTFVSADEARLVGVLKAHGFLVSRDDDLVANACGYIIG
jgi:hypothetical protein